MAWEILQEDVLAKGNREIKKQVVRFPDGNIGNYYIIDGNDTVLVIGHDNEKLICIRQYRHPINKTAIEFSSGVMENGETTEEAARREFREETGYSATKMRLLGSFYESFGTAKHKMHVYLATQLQKGEQEMDRGDKGYEDIEVLTISMKEFHHMILNGEIEGMASILAFYMLKDKLDSGEMKLE